MSERLLTDFELMVMLAVLRVRDDAYGVPSAREIEQTGGRSVTHAAVYLALDRLRQRGLVTSRLGDPTPGAVGGRRSSSALRRPACAPSAGRSVPSSLSGTGFPN